MFHASILAQELKAMQSKGLWCCPSDCKGSTTTWCREIRMARISPSVTPSIFHKLVECLWIFLSKIFVSILLFNLLWHFSSKNLIRAPNANRKRGHRLTAYTLVKLLLLLQCLLRQIWEGGGGGKEERAKKSVPRALATPSFWQSITRFVIKSKSHLTRAARCIHRELVQRLVTINTRRITNVVASS